MLGAVEGIRNKSKAMSNSSICEKIASVVLLRIRAEENPNSREFLQRVP